MAVPSENRSTQPLLTIVMSGRSATSIPYKQHRAHLGSRDLGLSNGRREFGYWSSAGNFCPNSPSREPLERNHTLIIYATPAQRDCSTLTARIPATAETD
jgi:hypothetical protein